MPQNFLYMPEISVEIFSDCMKIPHNAIKYSLNVSVNLSGNKLKYLNKKNSCRFSQANY